MNNSVLWAPNPSFLAENQLSIFTQAMERSTGKHFPAYEDLWEWSVSEPKDFWSKLWDYCDIIGEKGSTVLAENTGMQTAKWFPNGYLNYAENLLRQKGDHDAIAFWGEDQLKTRLSHDQLRLSVAQCQQALVALGVKKGDRIAGYLPNMPETIIAMLATAALGAIWCSASPDFGVSGVLDRFSQISPKVLFCCDAYVYNGKIIDCMEKNIEVAKQLPSLDHTVVIPYMGKDVERKYSVSTSLWTDFLAQSNNPEPVFTAVPFNHPLFIMFSSGTTGIPKCIVHGHGGTLLQHLKEHRLHADVRMGDRFFYFTTCGWMMWNWLVTGLASGATLLLYDGSPFAGNGHLIFDLAQAEGMTQLGTSAKFIEAASKMGLNPKETHELPKLRSIFSTGSPLTPDSFDYVYRSVKSDVLLASISGGTDIISCFALGCPTRPVHRGEIQCRGLGLAVDVYDTEGNSVHGEKGELVCTAPFPCMPVGFWNDPDGQKYHKAYFARFDNVWCHGDFVELTANDGMIIYGRSDAVLNPGGVRIGTAEIYRQVDTIDEVLESIVVGQNWQDDVRVVLFVKLREGIHLDDQLKTQIKQRIREKATPRHVPALILAVADIPRTKSGKIVELAVREIIHGRPVVNQHSLANPEALAHFANRPELSESV